MVCAEVIEDWIASKIRIDNHELRQAIQEYAAEIQQQLDAFMRCSSNRGRMRHGKRGGSIRFKREQGERAERLNRESGAKKGLNAPS